MAAGTICETGETGENTVFGALFWLYCPRKRSDEFQFCSIENRHAALEQNEFLTGLTGLPPFPLSLQRWQFEAGPKARITRNWQKASLYGSRFANSVR